MARILITRDLPDAVMARARATHEVNLHTGGPLSEAEARAAMVVYDGIVPTLGDAFRAGAFADIRPRTKVLANFGVGYNHIDAGAARAAGVVVTNTPGAVTDATADIGMMLVLMVCRRAGEGERIVRAGRWGGWGPTQFLGFHVSGKRLGIVGMGRIGKAIARRAHHGFGMEILFYNRSPVADPGVPARQVATLNDLLTGADIVVLAVPATPATRHLIGAAELALMGSSRYLVNIARGDVVDEAALVAALKAGTIAGAGLDVYEREPVLERGLTDCENAVLLPHIGTAALEVRERMGFMALDNLDAVLEGRAPPNPV
jgi:lactate dehydrogenase-like 2-hydroxyacid dehydrogenase